MGLSKSKQTTTNAPSAYAKPYIDAGAGALQSAYSTSSGLASGISNTLAAQLPGLEERAFSVDPAVAAATTYNTDVLGGKYLDAGNSYLQGQIDQTGADVRSRVQAQFSSAGRTGSGANQFALGRGLASAENALRYQNYGDERARMGAAASLAPSLANAQYSGLSPYLQVAQSAVGLPMDLAKQYSGGLGSLVGGYNTSTQTSSPSLGAILAQMAAQAAKAYAGGG